MPPPRWQRPLGATAGTWDYIQSDSVAEDFDEYFSDHPLMAFDSEFVRETLLAHSPVSPSDAKPCVADLGCGTGRALIDLAQHGFRGLAIDLSQKMLDQVRRKSATANLPIDTLQANWVELDAVADESVDHSISLFSTLGMIHGAGHRQAALDHTRRILKPSGVFILHVHNFWFNLYDADGPWWVLRSIARSCWDRGWERGDKYYTYRGVANMFLHVFTRREICTALRRAGFSILQVTPLALRTHRPLKHAWLASSLRAVGWMIVAQRPCASPSGRVGA